MAVSTLACVVSSPAPDFWISWGGDLATGMHNLHVLMGKNPSLDMGRAANALIGAYELNDPYLKSADKNGVSIECNYSDLCSDADSLALSGLLKQAKDEVHTLSRTMREYYSTISIGKRYSAYQHDVGGDFSPSRLAHILYDKMMDKPAGELFELHLGRFYKDATDAERQACCDALASYLHVKIRS